MTYSQRRDRLSAQLTAQGLDALIVSDLINIRYLSGFTGSNAALVVYADQSPAVLATDGRYRIQAAQQVPDLTVAIERACAPHLVGTAAAQGAHRIGFESHIVTVDGWEKLKQQLADCADNRSGAQLVRSSGMIETLREVKDLEEIAMLARACETAHAALADLVAAGGVRVGRTEREISRDLESLMVDHGAAGPAFDTIVATGAHSAIPHHRPTDAVVATGDFVKIDFGALVDGYHSDMTRTFVVGSVSDWQREIYDVVATAQQAGCQALAVGAALSEVDATARDIIDKAGYGQYYSHGLGHGVGLQIHEAPGINSAAVGSLMARSVVTVEPGVYLSDRGGVRIEDTVVVGEHGPDVLTKYPKELMVLA